MLLSSLLFGISASLDALLVGISYGIRKIRICLWQNLTISLITLLGTCLSAGLGHRLAAVLPEQISKYAGSLVLILLGIYYILKWTIPHLQSMRLNACSNAGPVPKTEQDVAGRISKTDRPAAPCLTPLEVLSLSLTLSVNNLSAGFSASLAGLSLLPAAASTLLCSLLFLFSGNRLGSSPWLQLAGCAAEPVSGLLLIGLGAAPFFL